jgi:hypothetical protein
MNAQLLVDAIVRQTTVLIAQVATAQGLRAPLAHLANQVFSDLSHELDAQGVSRKVSADMFGMALRAYLKKIRRLNESVTVRGRSLWEAVFEFLREGGVVSRQEVILAFAQDDEDSLKAVLHDLVESGLVFATGTPPAVLYQAASTAALGRLHGRGESSIDELLWAVIHVDGPVSRAMLSRLGAVSAEVLDAALARLVAAGRVAVAEDGQDPVYRSHRFFVPLGAELGWEGAVLDHFSAVVQTVCSKLRDVPRAAESDLTGGSTYRLLVWEGHPLEAEVMRFLSTLRRELGGLRSRIEQYNRLHEKPARFRRVVIYGGQCVTEEETEG